MTREIPQTQEEIDQNWKKENLDFDKVCDSRHWNKCALGSNLGLEHVDDIRAWAFIGFLDKTYDTNFEELGNKFTVACSSKSTQERREVYAEIKNKLRGLKNIIGIPHADKIQIKDLKPIIKTYNYRRNTGLTFNAFINGQ